MLTVEFHRANFKAVKWEKAGEIGWDGKRMTASTEGLRRLLAEPIRVRDGKDKWRELHAAEDPELFMRSLWLYYSGSYTFALPAKES